MRPANGILAFSASECNGDHDDDEEKEFFALQRIVLTSFSLRYYSKTLGWTQKWVLKDDGELCGCVVRSDTLSYYTPER